MLLYMRYEHKNNVWLLPGQGIPYFDSSSMEYLTYRISGQIKGTKRDVGQHHNVVLQIYHVCPTHKDSVDSLYKD